MSTKNRNSRIRDIQKEDTIVSLTSLLTQYTVQMDEFYKLAATTSVSLLTLIGVLSLTSRKWLGNHAKALPGRLALFQAEMPGH